MRSAAFIISLFIVAGCASNTERVRPSYVISEDSMAALLVELQMLNALNQHRDVRRKKLTDFVKVDQRALYDSLGLDEARIDSSMNYYLKDYKQFQEIHDNAMNMLSERLARRKVERAERRERLKISEKSDK